MLAVLLAGVPGSPLHGETVSSVEPIRVTAWQENEDDASAMRPETDPKSIRNPYRVPETARFGTEILTEKEIRAYAPKDIFDLLDKAAGMNMTYQGRRSPYFLDERSGGTLTYIIDGAILPTSVSRILQKIPISAIEQIEIVRGSTTLNLAPSIPAGSAASGSGLVTGYVIIRTKKPLKTEARFTAFIENPEGSPAGNGQSAYAGTTFGQKDEFADGYLGLAGSRFDRPGKSSRFDGQDGRSGMATVGYRTGKFSVGFMGYRDEGRFELQRGVTHSGSLANDRWAYDPLKTTVLSTDMSMNWSDNQVTMLSLFTTKYEQYEHNGSFLNSTETERQFEEETRGLSLRHNARFENTLVSLGGQLVGSEGFGATLNNAYNNFETSIRGWSAAVEQKLFDGRVSVDAGVRQDIQHIDRSSLKAANDKVNNDIDMPPSRIFAFGGKWNISDMFALSTRYYNGRQGNSGELDFVTKADVQLDPEEQHRFEIALEGNISKYFRPILTWFDIDIKNQKTPSADTYIVDGETYYYYTQSDSRRRGIELGIKGNITPRTAYGLSWTHLVENEVTSAKGTTDNNGSYYPENLISAFISHAWDDYRFSFSIKQVGEWDTSSSPAGIITADLGDYTRVDANIARDFVFDTHKLTATLYGRNLTDEHYVTRYVTGYYPDRGRTIGLELSFVY